MWNSFSVSLKEAFDSSSDSPEKSVSKWDAPWDLDGSGVAACAYMETRWLQKMSLLYKEITIIK